MFCIKFNRKQGKLHETLTYIGVRQYAAKYKSINYYNIIIMIQYRIGFI